MKSVIKKPNKDLRHYYRIFLEIGLIIALLLFIGLTKVDLNMDQSEVSLTDEREVIKMEEVVQTQQESRPPPPPRPQVPVAVPNDEIVEDVVLDIDAEISMDEPLAMPEPPAEEAEEEEEEDFFVAVEEMPELKGSMAELQSKIVYPDRAQQVGIEGRVIVQFIVNESGGVEEPRVIRGIGGGCDEEAVRVSQLAEFKPGKQRGVPVRVQYSMPFNFKLRK
ncbi:MAG: energy transducer TonB [Bacteroidota bacterium]